MRRIDTTELKRRVNLLDLASSVTHLEWAAGTDGGEWEGPCPFCPEHGRDRLHVQPNYQPWGVWFCRQCTGVGEFDAIAFGQRLWPGLRFPEVCERLVGGALPITYAPPVAGPEPVRVDTPPAPEWQDCARQVIEAGEEALWSRKCRPVLDTLFARGLTERTIRKFRLGYIPTGREYVFGREIAGLWVPRGITIPTLLNDEIWSVKIRLWDKAPCQCKCGTTMSTPGICPNCDRVNKYRGIKGNRSKAIFNAFMLDTCTTALFVEGEFDCMVCDQEIGDVIPTATAGSASNGKISLVSWGRYLVNKKTIFVCMDQDRAGNDGAETLMGLSSRCVRIAPPEGYNDINDFYIQGNGDLWRWIKPYLDYYDPVAGRVDEALPGVAIIDGETEALKT